MKKGKISLLKLSRQTHKWLMAVIGIQIVIWSITGFYMVYLNIDYIHGDTLVKNQQVSLNNQSLNYSIDQLFLDHPNAQRIELSTFLGEAVYRFNDDASKYLVNASTGEVLSPLSKMQALKLATFEYTGSGNIESVLLIAESPPYELSQRHLPVWQVNFDDLFSPTLYVSIDSGKIVTKRHELWRIFDWMFRFHVMDYQDSKVDNTLLFVVAFLSLIAAITGLILIYFRFIKTKVNKVRNKKAQNKITLSLASNHSSKTNGEG